MQLQVRARKVRDDPGDDLRLPGAGDDPELPTAMGAAVDLAEATGGSSPLSLPATRTSSSRPLYRFLNVRHAFCEDFRLTQ